MAGLRIHFLVGTIEPTGTYFRFHNLAIALAGFGHEVSILGLDPRVGGTAREERRDGVRYVVTPSLPGQSLFGSWNHPGNALRRLWAGCGPCDVAHLFQPFLGPSLAWLLRAPRGALRAWDWDDLWGEDGLLSDRRRRGPLWVWERFWTPRLERWLPTQADVVTVCSDDLAARVRRRTTRDVVVVRNGYWPQALVPREEARRRIGLQAGVVYAGFMGRTHHELSWCVEALARVPSPRLRLAICGPPASLLAGLGPSLRDRIDHLGLLSPAEARMFGAAIDLGLLPLEDNAFNRSRFPIKFAEYLGAGTPTLVSEVGECARLADEIPGSVKAGLGKEDWCRAFAAAAEALSSGRRPAVDREMLESRLSWRALGRQWESAYARARATATGGGSV